MTSIISKRFSSIATESIPVMRSSPRTHKGERIMTSPPKPEGATPRSSTRSLTEQLHRAADETRTESSMARETQAPHELARGTSAPFKMEMLAMHGAETTTAASLAVDSVCPLPLPPPLSQRTEAQMGGAFVVDSGHRGGYGSSRPYNPTERQQEQEQERQQQEQQASSPHSPSSSLSPVLVPTMLPHISPRVLEAIARAHPPRPKSAVAAIGEAWERISSARSASVNDTAEARKDASHSAAPPHLEHPLRSHVAPHESSPADDGSDSGSSQFCLTHTRRQYEEDERRRCTEAAAADIRKVERQRAELAWRYEEEAMRRSWEDEDGEEARAARGCDLAAFDGDCREGLAILGESFAFSAARSTPYSSSLSQSVAQPSSPLVLAQCLVSWLMARSQSAVIFGRRGGPHRWDASCVASLKRRHPDGFRPEGLSPPALAALGALCDQLVGRFLSAAHAIVATTTLSAPAMLLSLSSPASSSSSSSSSSAYKLVESERGGNGEGTAELSPHWLLEVLRAAIQLCLGPPAPLLSSSLSSLISPPLTTSGSSSGIGVRKSLDENDGSTLAHHAVVAFDGAVDELRENETKEPPSLRSQPPVVVVDPQVVAEVAAEHSAGLLSSSGSLPCPSACSSAAPVAAFRELSESEAVGLAAAVQCVLERILDLAGTAARGGPDLSPASNFFAPAHSDELLRRRWRLKTVGPLAAEGVVAVRHLEMALCCNKNGARNDYCDRDLAALFPFGLSAMLPSSSSDPKASEDEEFRSPSGQVPSSTRADEQLGKGERETKAGEMASRGVDATREEGVGFSIRTGFSAAIIRGGRGRSSSLGRLQKASNSKKSTVASTKPKVLQRSSTPQWIVPSRRRKPITSTQLTITDANHDVLFGGDDDRNVGSLYGGGGGSEEHSNDDGHHIPTRTPPPQLLTSGANKRSEAQVAINVGVEALAELEERFATAKKATPQRDYGLLKRLKADIAEQREINGQIAGLNQRLLRAEAVEDYDRCAALAEQLVALPKTSAERLELEAAKALAQEDARAAAEEIMQRRQEKKMKREEQRRRAAAATDEQLAAQRNAQRRKVADAQAVQRKRLLLVAGGASAAGASQPYAHGIWNSSHTSVVRKGGALFRPHRRRGGWSSSPLKSGISIRERMPLRAMVEKLQKIDPEFAAGSNDDDDVNDDGDGNDDDDDDRTSQAIANDNQGDGLKDDEKEGGDGEVVKLRCTAADTQLLLRELEQADGDDAKGKTDWKVNGKVVDEEQQQRERQRLDRAADRARVRGRESDSRRIAAHRRGMEQAQSCGPPTPPVGYCGAAGLGSGESLPGDGPADDALGDFTDEGESVQFPKQPPTSVPLTCFADNQTTEHRSNHSHRSDPLKVSAVGATPVAAEDAKARTFSSRTGSAAARHIRERRRSISPRLIGDRRAANIASSEATVLLQDPQQYRRDEFEQPRQERDNVKHRREEVRMHKRGSNFRGDDQNRAAADAPLQQPAVTAAHRRQYHHHSHDGGIGGGAVQAFSPAHRGGGGLTLRGKQAEPECAASKYPIAAASASAWHHKNERELAADAAEQRRTHHHRRAP